MNYILALIVAAIVTAAVAKKGSNISQQDFNRLLNDPDFVYRQLQCVLSRGSCDNTGNQLKLAIPEVLVRNCRTCSPDQARNADRLVDFVQSKYPKEFRQIKAKYARRG